VFAKAGVSDKAAYKQLGNAVNVGVARLAASALMSELLAAEHGQRKSATCC